MMINDGLKRLAVVVVVGVSVISYDAAFQELHLARIKNEFFFFAFFGLFLDVLQHNGDVGDLVKI